MRCFATERRGLSGSEDGDCSERGRRGRHGERTGHGRKPIRLLRQDDRMPVMVRCYEFSDVPIVNSVTMGRKPSAKRPEEHQQEA